MVTLKMHQKPLKNLYQHKYSEESFLFVGGTMFMDYTYFAGLWECNFRG